jgi:hypothetical protein
MAEWIASENFLTSHPTVFTFDSLNLLAESDLSNLDPNMLKSEDRQGVD